MEQIKMGALYLDGLAQLNPQNPVWNGDIPKYDEKAKITVADAPEGNTDIQITWNVVKGMEKWSRTGTLLIADRVLLSNVSWDDLSAAGFAEGVTIHLKGRPHRCHLLPVGGKPDAPNAWDDALDHTTEDNEIWHWCDSYFWGAEDYTASSRALRGYASARHSYWSTSSLRHAFYGFRPALEPLGADNMPLKFEADSKDEILKTIRDARSSLQFFAELVQKGYAKESDVRTHMGLLEYQVSDLSKLTGYESALAEEVENRHAEIRRLNCRIRELEEQKGDKVTAVATSAAIRKFEGIFRAWYESCGFHYASIEYGPYGFIADFGMDLNVMREPHLSRHDSHFENFAQRTAFIPDSKEWDVIRDSFHHELSDTDRNRTNLKNLFSETFPESCIHQFRSRRNDFGSFSLAAKVFVPFEDIEKFVSKEETV